MNRVYDRFPSWFIILVLLISFSFWVDLFFSKPNIKESIIIWIFIPVLSLIGGILIVATRLFSTEKTMYWKNIIVTVSVFMSIGVLIHHEDVVYLLTRKYVLGLHRYYSEDYDEFGRIFKFSEFSYNTGMWNSVKFHALQWGCFLWIPISPYLTWGFARITYLKRKEDEEKRHSDFITNLNQRINNNQ